jgi:glycosyltransferase involved in cell wall biosynthesis/spore maturation protein CgeB
MHHPPISIPSEAYRLSLAPLWRVPGRIAILGAGVTEECRQDVDRLALALKEKGHSVLVFGQAAAALSPCSSSGGIRYIAPELEAGPADDTVLTLAIESQLRVFKPSLVVASGPSSFAACAVRAARQLGLPVVYDIVDSEEVATDSPRGRYLKSLVVQSADAVLLRTAQAQRYLESLAVRPGSTISLVDADTTGSPSQRAADGITRWIQRTLPKLPIQQSASRLRATGSSPKMRVAGVMDEFTFHSFAPECQLLQLHPEMAIEQLEMFRPDFLFVESAWKGQDGLWQQKISNSGEEITACIDWCKREGIPTMFWNKEDPVHFGTFIPLAKQVDYVFTTDIDCIPKYKYHVKHEQVYLLPFAAQPEMHNPVELYERKNAFNFAGSYYLRYPERQRDFSALIRTVKKFRPVDIYDRNFDNPHPHYTFPDEYKPMILGKLPFSEIDRAYKGYRYGINMNTIKQSQTMFARRVFELLASNTVVVSNFSRGTRLMFGDLVVCSDNASQLEKSLQAICEDEVSYRKLRLLGLRKVMAEHTYAHRLAYIWARMQKAELQLLQPAVIVMARSENREQSRRLVENFAQQRYPNKHLFIVGDPSNAGPHRIAGIRHYADIPSCVEAMRNFGSDCLIGVMSADDYYGPCYLTDLQLSCAYSQADAFGKAVHYAAESGALAIQFDNGQYKPVATLPVRAALVRLSSLPSDWRGDEIAAPQDAVWRLGQMLAIDEFSYIRNGATLAQAVQQAVDDLDIADQGVSFTSQLARTGECLPAATAEASVDISSLPHLSVGAMAAMFTSKDALKFSSQSGKLELQSLLAAGQYAYAYAKKLFTRDELNLVLNSQFQLVCEGTLQMRTVFEFLDRDGKKISHQMNDAGDKHSLAIPPSCIKIRFGLRVSGAGEAAIERLILSGQVERPAAIACRSPNLVLTKQYPAYDDLYRYGFLHSRVRAYKESGLLVDIFRISGEPTGYKEFENIDVATGDAALLDATLATGEIKHVLVHLLDEKMWQVLRKYVDRLKITVWVHGAEVQHWRRRSFEFERMDAQEISRQKKLSDRRMEFWRTLLAEQHKNLSLVFVSQIFADEVLSDLEISLPKERYAVIPNYIDGTVFPYIKKSSELRKRVLSIRPFASRKYGNDLSAKAILELSKRACFSAMSFHIVGDGDLFEEITQPLRNFNNVKLERRFLTHKEIRQLHQENGVFLNPTRMDSQGVSRDEAMSSGLVSVTTNVAAVPEFVDNSSGRLVPAEDYVALADALEELHADPQLFETLSAQGAARVRRQSGFEATILREMHLIDVKKPRA